MVKRKEPEMNDPLRMCIETIEEELDYIDKNNLLAPRDEFDTDKIQEIINKWKEYT